MSQIKKFDRRGLNPCQISKQVDTISSQKIYLRALKLADIFDRRARPEQALSAPRLCFFLTWRKGRAKAYHLFCYGHLGM